MTEIQKWNTIDSRFIVNDRWCRIRQDKVELPNGLIVDDYYVNVRPDIALVLPITLDRQIIFVRQYRHGVREILIELPAGTFDPTIEDSLSAAKRELEEETGYVATEFTKLATLYDNPVKDTNRVHLFIAENATPTGQKMLDDTEAVEVILISLTEIKQHIDRGTICVCGSLSAIYLGLDFLNK
jgi:8-oxo-dGTP pyrophosphatase MutT (NUDIX family)